MQSSIEWGAHAELSIFENIEDDNATFAYFLQNGGDQTSWIRAHHSYDDAFRQVLGMLRVCLTN